MLKYKDTTNTQSELPGYFQRRAMRRNSYIHPLLYLGMILASYMYWTGIITISAPFNSYVLNFYCSQETTKHQNHDPVSPDIGPSVISDIHNSTLGFQKVFVISKPDRNVERDVMDVAASLTGISFEIIEAAPKEESGDSKSQPSKIHGIRRILEEGLDSALILDDDVEWDISLKSQLEDFALGSRFISSNIPRKPYTHSPYGDNWDVLWLGHCGAQQDSDSTLRFVLKNDPTVPPPDIYESWYKHEPDMSRFDNNTRLVYRNRLVACHYAVAVSYSGAQKIVATMASKWPFSRSENDHDAGMSILCERGDLLCVASNPSLMSDFQEEEDDAHQSGIARGVKTNLMKLARGEGDDIKVPWQIPILRDPLEREYLYH